jgi:Ornithine cyclodeaminase/mu-crystallin family
MPVNQALTAQTTPEALYRTDLAGAGASLGDAFRNLEHSPQVERVIRHSKRDLLSARVALTPEERRGYWELTSIRDALYIVLSNFSYKQARLECVPGHRLLQFHFQVSGDMTYRADDDEIIIFDSTGTALQDAAAAALVYEQALKLGRGQSFAFWE